MDDRRCFVQFSHPGQEHEPDPGATVNLPGGCSIGESGGAEFLTSFFRSALRLVRDAAFIFRNDIAGKGNGSAMTPSRF